MTTQATAWTTLLAEPCTFHSGWFGAFWLVVTLGTLTGICTGEIWR